MYSTREQSSSWINKLPILSIAIIFFGILFINLNNKRWEDPNRVILHDVASYYAYLPGAFIHHDLLFRFIYSDFSFYKDRFRLNKSPEGKPVIQTTMGLSILYSPFFFLAHAFAAPLGYEQDGYSFPYRFSLLFSALFYLIIGLFFLQKVLRRYFDPLVTAITLLVIVFGTNLLHYSTNEAPMSHAFNFSIIAVFLYLVIRWYEQPGIKFSVLIGLLAGLIVLIRPSNILVVILFIFWDIKSWTDLKRRIPFFLRNYIFILIMAGAFVIVWIPQFIYWKAVSGSYMFYSYSPYGERFFFDSPKVISQLFSYRKGWLLYTPIMFFGLTGIALISKEKLRCMFMPVLVFMIAMVYLLSSWWSWWFGGGFGLRSYIDTYAIMALPLAAIISFGLKKRSQYRILTSVLIILLVSLNLFQTWQYQKGLIHHNGMTRQAYWYVFGKLEHDPITRSLIEIPDHTQAVKGNYVNFPKETYVAVTEENCIEVISNRMRNNEDWLRLIKKKADERGSSVEEVIFLDAEWICRNQKPYEKKEAKPSRLRKFLMGI